MNFITQSPFFTALKTLHKSQLSLFITTMANCIGTTAVIFLVLYLNKDLGISIEMAGVIASFYGVGAFFSGIAGGLLTDRFGPFWVMLFSFIFTAIVLLLFPLVHSIPLLILMTTLWGIVDESYRPAMQVAVNDFSLPEQRVFAYALTRVAFKLGMSTGPLAGSYLFSINGAYIFTITGLIVCLAAVFMFIKFRPHFKERVRQQSSTKEMLTSMKVPLLDVKMLSAMLGFLLIMLCFHQQNAMLLQYIKDDLHKPEIAFGWLSAINMVLVFGFQLPINAYISRWPHHIVLTLGAALFASGFAIFGLVPSLLGVGLGIAIATTGEVILFPKLMAYIIELAPKENKGAYTGVYSMTTNIAYTIALSLGAFIFASQGAKTLWLSCFILGMVAAGVFWLTTKPSYVEEGSELSA